MSAALFLIDTETAARARPGSEVALTGPEGRHAASVARVGVGERVDLGDGEGLVLSCVVVRVDGPDLLVATVQEVTAVEPSSPRVVVVQALPKGERGETAVQTLTEVGVDEIVPWKAERCVARWVGDKAMRGRDKWAAVARSSGKQSRRARFPEVSPLAGSAAVESRIRRAVTAVMLHEEAKLPLHAVNLPASGEVLVIVGPEGGISPAETTRFSEAGAVPVRLGPSVLRTSTAGTVAAGIILSRTARWS